MPLFLQPYLNPVFALIRVDTTENEMKHNDGLEIGCGDKETQFSTPGPGAELAGPGKVAVRE